MTANTIATTSAESQYPLPGPSTDMYQPLLQREDGLPAVPEAIKRVAVIFDDRVRPDTTGGYCLRALRKLVEAEHVLPDQLHGLSGHDFDLYVNIDDGLTYHLPPHLRPSVLWAIDTHLNPERLIVRGRHIDFVFAAQHEGAALLRQCGVNCLGWLPLACDPEMHRPHDLEKSLDICFVAHLNTTRRRALAELIQQHFPRSFVGQRFFEQMAQTYSASCLTVNLSVCNDLNMRVFEALACGSMLLTDELAGPSIDIIFKRNEHLVIYRDIDELLSLSKHYLIHEQERLRIAHKGRELVLARHTYVHRMRMMLAALPHCSPCQAKVKSQGRSPAVARQLKPLTSIVIPARNQLSFTRQCLESVRAHCSTPYELIIVDNASTDGTLEYLRTCEDVMLIENQENRGFPASVNQGLDASCGNHILLLNNDTILTSGAFERMMAVMDSDAMIGLVGPSSNNVPGPQRVAEAYQLAELESFAAELAARRSDATIEVRVLAGFCLLLRREFADRIGPFDESFGVGTYDDYDYCMRAALAGYRMVIACGAFVHHFGAVTLQAEGLDVDGLLATNQARFIQKWGIKPLVDLNRQPENGSLTSIIIVTHNQIECTRQCLDSLAAHTPEPHEIIIVDNGSTDGTVDYLHALPTVQVIENKTNAGFPAAVNQGIRLSKGRQVLLLNNDVVVTPDWLELLLAALDHAPDIGLVGPVTNCASGPQQVPVEYTGTAGLDSFAGHWAQRHGGQVIECQRLVGFCLLLRREVVDRIGYLDERFGIGNFEDDDYCRRALAAGYRVAIAQGCFVHHFGSATFKNSDVNYPALLETNRRLYEDKWRSAAPADAVQEKDNPAGTANAAVQTAPEAGPRLSLCMIVRDSSRTLAACLDSAQPWVDEIVIVDTGSMDDTIEIARRYTSRIIEFPWCDDFSAARNVSIREATGDWIVWMDSDDTIDAANGEKIRGLIRRDHAPALLGFIMQVHCPASTDAGAYATATVVDHVKLFRNKRNIHFSGRIHEQVLPCIRSLGGEVAWTDIFVVHSGSDTTPEGRVRKRERDLRILQLELAENPDSTFTLFNVGMTLLDAGRPSEALNALCRSLQLASSGESHLRKLYALLVQAYTELERRETALWTCLQGLRVCPDDPELLFRRAVLEQSLGKLDLAEASYRTLAAMPRDRHFSSIDSGILGVKCWHNLAVLYAQRGQHSAASEAWRHVLEFDRRNPLAWRGLVDALSTAADIPGLEKSCEELRGSSLPTDLAAIGEARLLVVRGEARKAVEHLKAAMMTNDSTDVLHELCALAFTHQFHDEAESSLEELVQRCPDNPAAHHNLAALYLQKRQHHKAAENARRSLALRPDYADTKRLLDLAIAEISASDAGCLKATPDMGPVRNACQNR